VGEKAEDRWDTGLQAMRQSLELSKVGQPEEALRTLDKAIAEANAENRGMWVGTLCRHAAVLSHAMGDVSREIQYAEQALPHTNDHRFALYNFARLLLRGGQVARAERYAMEARKPALEQNSEADRDLVAAILKEWPNLSDNS
jgi:tetratricopeptide (TPR) repeat protein